MIRPWKSRLGLFYIKSRSFLIDIKLIVITILSIFSREMALRKISTLLERKGADHELIRIALRTNELVPKPPPGTDRIVTNRSGAVD